MKRLFTIGYEGADVQDFVDTLVAAGVDLLLDVRELPMSRRRGFSKTKLAESLAQAGIAYRHERLLGSPSAIRHKLRADGDYPTFFRAFRRHLDKQADLLLSIAEDLPGKKVALMCFERNHTECHRSVVAETLGELVHAEARHLGVKDAGKESNAPRAHSR